MNINKKIHTLFNLWNSERVQSIELLPASGSHRKYYRIFHQNGTTLGVYNEDKAENKAYVDFSQQFSEYKLPIPIIYATYLEERIYFVQDLGDTTLFTALMRDGFSPRILEYYKLAIQHLIKFQITAGKTMDYTHAYPRKAFDQQSMRWDLSYFKYYFLKLGNIPFDEDALEIDFNTLINYLSQVDASYFLYRDFQSRNIMVQNNKLYFIDFQGGRKGALAYDLASLLYDAKANLSHDLREELLNFYIAEVSKTINISASEFKNQFYGFVLIRILQAMGAYGLRGFYEKKEIFLKSIPYAIQNLSYLEKKQAFNLDLPALKQIFHYLGYESELREFKSPIFSTLHIQIQSFSFKKAHPKDTTGNGGGYIFDCRALPNPGRLEAYKHLTGKDPEVIQYLQQHEVVRQFVEQCVKLVTFSIQNYTERGFTNLMVSFGCTGGQHRSVYCAEKFAQLIAEKYQLNLSVTHLAQENI